MARRTLTRRVQNKKKTKRVQRGGMIGNILTSPSFNKLIDESPATLLKTVIAFKEASNKK